MSESRKGGHESLPECYEQYPMLTQDFVSTIANGFEIVVKSSTVEERQAAVGSLCKRLYELGVVDGEHIPETYWNEQARISDEKGRGELDSAERQSHIQLLQCDQRLSVDSWVQVATEGKADGMVLASAPTSVRLFVLLGAISTGYDPLAQEYIGRHTNATLTPPEPHPHAIDHLTTKLAETYGVDVLTGYGALDMLLRNQDFGVLYANALHASRLQFTESEVARYLIGMERNRPVEYPDGKPMEEMLQDEAKLDCIEQKIADQEPLTVEELVFLYQVERQILLPGDEYAEVKRVEAIIQERDILADYRTISEANVYADTWWVRENARAAKHVGALQDIRYKSESGIELSDDELLHLYDIYGSTRWFEFPKFMYIHAKRLHYNYMHETIRARDALRDAVRIKYVIAARNSERGFGGEAFSEEGQRTLYNNCERFLSVEQKQANGEELGADDLAFLYLDYTRYGISQSLREFENDIYKQLEVRFKDLRAQRDILADYDALAASEYTDSQWVEQVRPIAEDTRRLCQIEARAKQQLPLTRDDLVFIYELERRVYEIERLFIERRERLPTRIDRLRQDRDRLRDMSVIFECEPTQIATEDAEIGAHTKVYVGSLSQNTLALLTQYEMSHAYANFPEGDLKPRRVVIGGGSRAALRSELDVLEVKYSKVDWVLEPGVMPVTVARSFDTIQLRPADLGLSGSVTYEQLYETACNDFGLMLCPPEVAFRYAIDHSGLIRGRVELAMKPPRAPLGSRYRDHEQGIVLDKHVDKVKIRCEDTSRTDFIISDDVFLFCVG